ncbi:hypothetical protein [uncultured Aliiroseovarius sp.]|uniref:hypothetical protein n=1 Tax=uncultured Aliiroseovarius sp. TaxID=1658783 RepID=UPI002605F8D7|nr:hypothetical protein [uncultured Aliiroseovarius sp.]
MTNETKIDTNAVTYVETRAFDLKEKRKAWEEGTYKRSNEELYELLDECLAFFSELKGDAKKCKALNDFLRSHKITFNDNASLATRIVRAVFNSSFQKRAYAYARVLSIAAEEKSPSESMSTFVTKRGGIEELRRKKPNGKTPAEERKDNIAFAMQSLSESSPLVQPFKVANSTRVPNDGAEHSLFVAVMRQEADGSYSMVYETSANALVNAALEQAGKEQNAEARNTETTRQQKQNAENSAQAAADAVQKALAA